MSLQNHSKLQEAIENGYTLDIGKYLTEGIELFKRNIGGFVGYTALFFGVILVLSFIPFIGSLALILVSPVLAVGFYIMAHQIRYNSNVEFNQFFRGFDYFGQLIVAYLIVILAFGVFTIPFGVALFTRIFDPELILDGEGFPFLGNFPWWTLLLMIPIIYLSIAWHWAPMFIIFYNLSPWEALETSRRLIHKRWWAMFLLVLVISLLGSAGYIALIVGILFTYPAVMCMDYAAFADVTGLTEIGSAASDDIVDHLVE